MIRRPGQPDRRVVGLLDLPEEGGGSSTVRARCSDAGCRTRWVRHRCSVPRSAPPCGAGVFPWSLDLTGGYVSSAAFDGDGWEPGSVQTVSVRRGAGWSLASLRRGQ